MELEENRKNFKPYLIVGTLLAVLLVGGGILALGSGNKSQSGDNTLALESERTAELLTSNPTASASSTSDVKIISVEAGSYYYKPNEIRVKKGEKVKINMTSKDMMHDFNIDELGVSIPITKAGGTASVEFTADKTGTFEYYCSVGNHRRLGQVGKLIVE